MRAGAWFKIPLMSASQAITAELRRWIVAQAEAGVTPPQMLASMVASGWQETVARQALTQTLGPLAQALPAVAVRDPVEDGWRPDTPSSTQQPVGDVPDPQVQGRHCIEVQGHTVNVVMSCQRPRVVVFANLLSPQECEALCQAAQPRLERSETVEVATGGNEVNAARTSDGMFFQRAETEFIAGIERRIAELVNWPVQRGEGLQILRYRPGAQYRPHFDYFDPAQPGTARMVERGGQRVGTLIIYLRAPQVGGATVFPDAGLEVAPVPGHAVFFSYDQPVPATLTLHGGAPVLAGEKWVATKWMRQREFF